MKTTNKFQWMAALVMGMAMTCVTMTSCSKEDNPVVDNSDIPSVGVMTVKELDELTTAEIGWVIAADGKAYMNPAAATAAGTEALAMVAHIYDKNAVGPSASLAVQLSCSPEYMNWEDANKYVQSLPEVSTAAWVLPSQIDWKNMFQSCAIDGDLTTVTDQQMKPIEGFKAKIVATGMGWENGWYWTSTEDGDRAGLVGPDILLPTTPYAHFSDAPKSYPYCVRACLQF